MKKTTQRRILNGTFWTVWLLASTLVLAQIAMATDAAYPMGVQITERSAAS